MKQITLATRLSDLQGIDVSLGWILPMADDEAIPKYRAFTIEQLVSVLRGISLALCGILHHEKQTAPALCPLGGHAACAHPELSNSAIEKINVGIATLFHIDGCTWLDSGQCGDGLDHVRELRATCRSLSGQARSMDNVAIDRYERARNSVRNEVYDNGSTTVEIRAMFQKTQSAIGSEVLALRDRVVRTILDTVNSRTTVTIENHG